MKLDLLKLIDAAQKAGLIATQSPASRSGFVDLVIAAAAAADPKIAVAVAVVEALKKLGVTPAIVERFPTAAGDAVIIRNIPEAAPIKPAATPTP